MKKLTFIFAIFCSILMSCKKEYTCSCQQTVTTTAFTLYGNYYPQSTNANTVTNSFKMKKEKAQGNCDRLNKVYTSTTGSGESQRTTTEIIECKLY